MRFIQGREKGSVTTFLVSALAVLLAVGLVSWLLWRFLGAPSRSPGNPTAQPTPAQSGSFKGDPSARTEDLLKNLNQKLESLNLLKLITREVSSRPATVQGRIISTYHEEFRLPLRYSLSQIAEQLNGAAKALGAGVASNKKGLLSFGFTAEWTPVEMVFERSSKPQVCLIIDDGGYQRGEALEHLYAFKVPVTVAIIPGVEFSRSLAEEFPAHGVEVMCHMPMEGHEKGAVGGDYQELLKKGMGSALARTKVEKALEDLPNCRGLNNHMGSVATTDPELMWDVCQVLKEKDFFIIDSRTTAESLVEPVARKAGVPVAHRDVFLDNVETPEAILKQMDQLVRRARRRGVAVGIGHFKTKTLKTLEEAVGRFKEQGIQFVYASEVVKDY